MGCGSERKGMQRGDGGISQGNRADKVLMVGLTRVQLPCRALIIDGAAYNINPYGIGRQAGILTNWKVDLLALVDGR